MLYNRFDEQAVVMRVANLFLVHPTRVFQSNYVSFYEFQWEFVMYGGIYWTLAIRISKEGRGYYHTKNTESDQVWLGRGAWLRTWDDAVRDCINGEPTTPVLNKSRRRSRRDKFMDVHKKWKIWSSDLTWYDLWPDHIRNM